MGEAVVTRLDGPAVETSIAKDMLRRGVWAFPVGLVISGLIWGTPGVLSTAFAMAIVAANFLLAAGLLSATARISIGLMMGTALFGYLIRLALIFLAVWLVHTAWWFEPVPLGVTLIATHLGLLFWELRYVSASLAYPGLKPDVDDRPSVTKES